MNLDQIMTSGQIATALIIIAFVLLYMAFGKRPSKSRKH